MKKQTANSLQKTGSIIHEIKQPLAAMSMLADLALSELNELPIEKRNGIEEYLNEIVKQGERSALIIKSMNSTNGDLQLIFKPTNVNTVIKQVLKEVKYSEQNNNLTIRQDLHKSLPLIEAARNAIHQLLTNLINNAIDAMRESSIKILTLRSRKVHRGIHIEVIDTGYGFDCDDDSQIFDAYYTTKGDKGTGLGLPICKKIVEKHNGTITVNGEIEEGTCFKIFLPLENEKK